MKIKKRNDNYKPQSKVNDEDDGDFGENYHDSYKATKKWYEEIAPDPKKFTTVTDQVLIEMKDEAKKCLDAETATYNIKNAKTNPDYRWMKTVMSKGTVSDKIAAYIVLIQDNPACNLETIRNLIGMVKVGKKKECVAVIDTLSELFLSDLLRPDAKLKPFHQRPLSQINELSSGNAVTRRKYLSYWYFEDQLKEAYTLYVQALNKACHDTVESNKEKAISAMSKLLTGNPEQEKNLLGNIVNKMGDPSQKVASKTMYCLTQMLHKHSNMQSVVLLEVEKLLFRQNIGHKAQYYSLCFLSQFYLCQEQPEVARKLIELYFSFFKKLIKEGDVDSRMMSALLIGVNRAYPYAKLELDKISEHINTMYRVVHIANFNVSLHALSLLYQVSEFSDNVNDRFYSALYRKLMDDKLATTTNQAMLLNLIYKALLRDSDRNRVLAFVKRLLQLCMNMQPNFACGILFLVSQIVSRKKDTLVLVLKKSEIVAEVGDDDDEEKYVDVKEESSEVNAVNEDECDEDKEHIKEEDNEVVNGNKSNVTGWYHCSTSKSNVKKNLIDYDPLARNPMYAGAQFSAYVELNELRNHFHPSVSLFAEKLLYNEKIVYSGDPLKDFLLIRFLDRFVFKNPKKEEELNKPDAHAAFQKRKMYTPKGVRSWSVTSSNYLNEKQENIPVDEWFMHTYLQKKYKDRPEKDEDDDSDMDSVASEEFEDMLNKMSGFKDLDDDLDYMNDIGESLKQNKSNQKSGKDDDEDASDSEDGDDNNDLSDADDDDNELSDDMGEEIDDDGLDEEDDLNMNEDDEELLKDIDDDDASDIVFGSDEDEDDDDDDDELENSKSSKKKKKKLGNGSIFASAEEFASILEEEGASKHAPGTSKQSANRDKADVKQLDWEDKRNRWMNGYNKAIGKKGKNFNNKRPHPNKQSSKNNKKKRF